MSEEKFPTYMHKVKCLNCQLHFTAYSYKPDWKPQTCPECETDLEMTGFLHWVEGSNLFIYEHVPGGSKFSEQGGTLP